MKYLYPLLIVILTVSLTASIGDAYAGLPEVIIPKGHVYEAGMWPMYQVEPTIQAASISSDGFQLVWSPPTGATSYILEIAKDPYFTSSSYVQGYEGKVVNGSPYQNGKLTEVISPINGNTFYYCRLRAVGPGGTSTYSNVIEVPILIVPATVPSIFHPSQYVASSGFMIGVNQSAGALSYEMEIADNPDFFGSQERFIPRNDFFGINNIPYSVSGLKGFTTYYCRVRGVGPKGTTANSNVISVTTLLAIPASPLAFDPTDVTVNAATLSWNDVHMADSYQLDITTHETFEEGYDTQTVNSTSVTLSDLQSNTIYQYRVRAVNTLGTSGNSRHVTFSTLVYIGPNFDKNYIFSYAPAVQGLTTIEQVTSKDVDEVNWSVRYFDGLGRPSQSVNVKASPGRMDIVQPFYYDGFGRESRQYLPYVENGPAHGSYREGAVSAQAAFYNAPPAGVVQVPEIDGVTSSFAETVFEASPLDRAEEQGAPGATWQPGGGHTVRIEYVTNGPYQEVLWTLSDEGGATPFAKIGQIIQYRYGKGELYKTITKDENWKETDGQERTVDELTDKQGRVVLKRGYRKMPYLDGYITLPLETRYIYDDFGNLRYVLPPAYQGGSFSEASLGFNDYIFAYHYDHRNRMVKKKVPGAGWVYLVYDDRDRLVLTQDGNQRTEGLWSFTKYDALNRPILSGIYENNAGSQEEMQGIVDTFYNNAEVFEWFEDRGTVAHGYTARSFPDSDISEYLSATYYDNYAFRDALVGFGDSFKFDKEQLDQKVTEVGTYDFPEVETSRVRGLMTGAKVKVLDSDKWISTVTYYDEKSRPIQTVAQNIFDQKDIFSTLYEFTGKVIRTKLLHNSVTVAGLSITRDFEYDHVGRLLETYHTTGNQTPVLISKKEYNELGELITNRLHSEDNTHFMQAVDFRYNARGWLTKINNSDLSPDDSGEPNDFFGMELFYDHGFDKPQFNGNISGVRWKNQGDGQERAYGYTYDPMNRLTGADYVAGSTGNWTEEIDRFEVGNIRYDLNGNIKSLHRNGLFRHTPGEAAEYGITDQLEYRYKGNQLVAVNDSIETPESTKSDFKDNGSKGTWENPEFTYDDNGNMTWDGNKGITVAYNHLNLPKRVDFGDGKYIAYTYDASGTKLKQTVNDGTNPAKETDYLGELVYENGELQFIQHEEGRIIPKAGPGPPYEYQYHLKDHLGNVRLTFTSKPEVEAGLATIEPSNADEELAYFHHVDQVTRINSDLFNHTEGADNHYSIRLSGTDGEKIGLAKSLAVMTGDTIRTAVWGKYLDPEQTNYNQLIQNMIATVATGGATGTNPDPGITAGGDGVFPFGGMLNKTDGDQGVMAYLNYLVFDKNGVLNEDLSGYKALSSGATEDGTGKSHEELSKEIVITEPGLVYIYLSNDSPEPMEVFFDDFAVEHVHSPIIQADDYYPFGLTFNSYNRENSVANNFLFNGKELDEETGWYDYHARQYDPAIGRWHVVDPMADQMRRHSPYNYAFNNPIRFIDPDGMKPEHIYELNQESGDINLVERNDDEKDVLVDSESNETIADEVDKGLLSDGMNIKQDGMQTENVKGGMNLAVNISMHVSEEIVGVIYQNQESGSQFLEVRPYEGGSVERNAEGQVTAMNSGADMKLSSTFTSANGKFTGTPAIAFHTHPGHPNAAPSATWLGTPKPSGGDFRIGVDNLERNNVNIPYMIYGKKSMTRNGVTSNVSIYKPGEGWNLRKRPWK